MASKDGREKKTLYEWLLEIMGGDALHYMGTGAAAGGRQSPEARLAQAQAERANTIVSFPSRPDSGMIPVTFAGDQEVQFDSPQAQRARAAAEARRNDPVIAWRDQMWQNLRYGGSGVNLSGAATAGTGTTAAMGATGSTPAGSGSYGVRRKGYESEEPRGEVNSDLWWNDMSRIYDKWSPELQQSWRQEFGTPRPGNPYQVYPYWKHDQPYRLTGGSNKRTMYNSRPWPKEDPRKEQDQTPPLGSGAIGNQMVTWRR